MKNVALFFIALVFGLSVAVSQDDKGAALKWENEKYDFGIAYTDDLPAAKMDIKFTNSGDKPLVLSNVRGCCGTRIHEWPKEPIQPGEEGVIKIEYRIAPRAHRVSRTITVTSNADPATSVFRIVGEVKER